MASIQRIEALANSTLQSLGSRIQRAATSPKWWLAFPAMFLFVVFFLAPLAWMVRLAFYEAGTTGQFYQEGTATLTHFGQIFGDRYFLEVVGVTFRIGGLTVLITMPLAWLLSVYIHRATGVRRLALLAAVILPKLTNLLVVMYGVILLLGRQGFVNEGLAALRLIDTPLPLFANIYAVMLGQVMIVLPYPVLMLVAAMESVDPVLEDAARSLGASPKRAYFETVFKLVLPTSLVASLVTLIWGLGAFVAPMVLGGPSLYTLTIEIYRQTLQHFRWPLGAALGVVSWIAISALIVGFLYLQRRTEERYGA